MGLWGSVSCNGVTQCWPAQRRQAIVPRSSPYMVHGKWIQARAHRTWMMTHTIDKYLANLYDHLLECLVIEQDCAEKEAQRQKQLYDRKVGAIKL